MGEPLRRGPLATGSNGGRLTIGDGTGVDAAVGERVGGNLLLDRRTRKRAGVAAPVVSSTGGIRQPVVGGSVSLLRADEAHPFSLGAIHMQKFPPFRSGNTLATTFSGTLTERFGKPVERIPTAERLIHWLEANGLKVHECSEEQLSLARELRDAIHVATTAVALGDTLPQRAVAVINNRSVGGNASILLKADGGRAWNLGLLGSVEDALSVVAADAISLLSGERGGRFALCASPTCRAAFFDTSQSRTRRWCDMNTCGNRYKKARLHARTVA